MDPLSVQVLWECGGTLAAPAIAAGVIHKALAFIAPKLVRCKTLRALCPAVVGLLYPADIWIFARLLMRLP